MASPSYATDADPLATAGPQAPRSSMSENLAVGFAEAAQAFSDEVASTSNCSDLAGNLVSGYLRANARFLEELANTSRRMTDEFSTQRWSGAQSDQDIVRLADIVAARIAAIRPQVSAPPEIDYDRLADLVAAKLAARPPA
jgi:hypothetical protein